MRARTTEFGYWAPLKLITLTAAAALLQLGLSLLSVVFPVGTAFFLLAASYFAYAGQRFSAQGGGLEGRLRQLVVDRVEWDGEEQAFDVGRGNRSPVIAPAHRFPASRVTGVDFWGGPREYSRRVRESNADLEGVDARVTFRRGSAVKEPFADGASDIVVSNLVLHEVRDAPDKTLAIGEALRVLRPGVSSSSRASSS